MTVLRWLVEQRAATVAQVTTVLLQITGAAVHTDAIKILGVTDLHRKSWNLGV